MRQHQYLMESEGESIRLDLKTDRRSLRKQARWAGVRAGMRGGRFRLRAGQDQLLPESAGPAGGGSVLGIDISPARIGYAQEHYHAPGIDYVCGDLKKSLEPYGVFDFIWVRFLLGTPSGVIVRNRAQHLHGTQTGRGHLPDRSGLQLLDPLRSFTALGAGHARGDEPT